ncbi:helix-turn-helix transcriptional regulator [bacterium]|nr:helix-turn-helix transcriptional regulator [bacterium]
MILPREPHLENIPLKGPVSFAARQFRLGHFPLNWHRHPEVELTCILRGSGQRYVGDSVEAFQADDLCLLAGGLPHSWTSAPGAPGGVKSAVVQFHPAAWGDVFWEMPEMRAINTLLARAQHGLQFTGAVHFKIAAPLEALCVEKSSTRRLLSLLEILHQLSAVRSPRTLSLGTVGTAPANIDARMHRVLERIHQGRAEPLSQAALAREARSSPTAFSRFFRKMIGKTFVNYVNDLRLGEASQQLLETNDSISEIAFRVGFGNLAHFNRRFRLTRGMAPREFRRRANPAAEKASG